jgi:hypothetical protein
VIPQVASLPLPFENKCVPASSPESLDVGSLMLNKAQPAIGKLISEDDEAVE